MKEFSAWTGNVFSFVASLSFFDKCSSCIVHLCAVLSKGESLQTTRTVFRDNVLTDQRLHVSAELSMQAISVYIICGDQISPVLILEYYFAGKFSRISICTEQSKIHKEGRCFDLNGFCYVYRTKSLPVICKLGNHL